MPLSVEAKTSILEQQIGQFEAELYQWELNRRTALALGLSTEQADEAINQLTTALKIRHDELTVLTGVATSA